MMMMMMIRYVVGIHLHGCRCGLPEICFVFVREVMWLYLVIVAVMVIGWRLICRLVVRIEKIASHIIILVVFFGAGRWK